MVALLWLVLFLGGARLYCSVVLLDGGPELMVSMISVSGLVSWVKWSLELNGLKRLMVSGAFGLWCRRVSNAFGLRCFWGLWCYSVGVVVWCSGANWSLELTGLWS